MKRIVGILMFLVLITGCEKYVVERSDVTLSGMYNIVKITTTDDEGIDSIYTNGVCENDVLPAPFDSITINDFLIEFSYVDVRFKLIDISQDIYMWEYGGNSDSTQIWYDIRGNHSYFSGYLTFSYKPKGNNSYRTVKFAIIEDGLTTLTLKSVGTYTNTKKSITLHLLRS